MKIDEAAVESRKPYSPPKIAHTEKIEARAVACVRNNDFECSGGPIQS